MAPVTTNTELCTAVDPHTELCTFVGHDAPRLDHDYRIFMRVVKKPHLHTVSYLRCVFCHVIACGSANDTDPCIEARHHEKPHRTRMGTIWARGDVRPSP